VSHAAGLVIVELPTPIYEIADHFLGSKDKKDPVVRRALQDIGQWGRGQKSSDIGENEGIGGVSKEDVISEIRENGEKITGMTLEWTGYGRDENFWIDSVVTRMLESSQKGHPCGMPNVRYPEESASLRKKGARHYHVICDEKERRSRLMRDYDPLIDESVSERYAIHLDNEILSGRLHSTGLDGAIWNGKVQAPSGLGVISIAEFKHRESLDNLPSPDYLTRTMAVPLITRPSMSSSPLPL